MKRTIFVLSLFAIGLTPMANADDAKTAERPSREEVRKEMRDLSPEDRAAKLRELKEKYGLAERHSPSREGFQNMAPDERRALSEKMRNMTPEERRAHIEQIRQRMDDAPPGDARIREFRQRAEKHLAELRQKQEAGTLNEREKHQLERMEEHMKRPQSHPSRLDSNPPRDSRAFTRRPRPGASPDEKDQ